MAVLLIEYSLIVLRLPSFPRYFTKLYIISKRKLKFINIHNEIKWKCFKSNE